MLKETTKVHGWTLAYDPARLAHLCGLHPATFRRLWRIVEPHTLLQPDGRLRFPCQDKSRHLSWTYSQSGRIGGKAHALKHQLARFREDRRHCPNPRHYRDAIKAGAEAGWSSFQAVVKSLAGAIASGKRLLEAGGTEIAEADVFDERLPDEIAAMLRPPPGAVAIDRHTRMLAERKAKDHAGSRLEGAGKWMGFARGELVKRLTPASWQVIAHLQLASLLSFGHFIDVAVGLQITGPPAPS